MAKQTLLLKLIKLTFIIFIIINLVTVFTPEIGFDALWYHLTLPKLYLLKTQWYFPGGLLYYSVMPRLAETIFIPLLKYTGSIGPKAVQFFSGIATCYLIYQIVLKLKQKTLVAWTAVILFYATWVVSWQSGSAYIDLIRTLFEALALYWLISKPNLKVLLPGIFLGLAIGTKWLSLGSLAIYAWVFSPQLIPIAIFIALPWFLIAFHYTGNPIYPILEPKLVNFSLSNFFPDDHLSPIMALIFLFSLFMLISTQPKIKKIAQIGLLGTIFTLITPSSSFRYLIPFLPAIVISGSIFIFKLKPKFSQSLIWLVLTSSFIVLTGRIYSLSKYIPFLLQKQTQNQFLTSHISKLPGTFVDSDNFVTKNLKSTDKILIDDLHNLYYFPYNFDHTSWVPKSNWVTYDYLITTNKAKFKQGNLVHTNPIGIKIYQLKN